MNRYITLSDLESMSTLSAQMVEAARDQDWDRLWSLEQEVARLRDDTPGSSTAPTSAERNRRITLMRQLLADDAEIRRHTEPWMLAVQAWLKPASTSPSARGRDQ